jgi:RNA polymerase sigma-70 factor (ECF subfamily)
MADDRPSMEADPSVELMLQLRDGNEAAFDDIVQRWQTPLLNFFYRSLGSHEQSEDLTQMVFIRLYRAAPKYQPKARFSTFLFQIARRLLINEYRRSLRKPLDTYDPADLHAYTSDHQERRHAELEEAFEQVLHKLPENQRTAILLLKQQELSYQEIADVMNANESAVKTWIFRARQFLKQELKDWV